MFRRPIAMPFLPVFGITGLVLGHISLLLFFLPIVGLPIGVFGIIVALVGTFFALGARTASLRWCLAGVAACILALVVNLFIMYAPGGDYIPDREVPRQWHPSPAKPWIPPPAKPGEWWPEKT